MGGVGWKLSVHGPAPSAWVPSASGNILEVAHQAGYGKAPSFYGAKPLLSGQAEGSLAPA